MNNYIESVKEFHEAFDHPINELKSKIDLKTRQLRIKLLFEELQELAEASDVRKTFVTLCETNSIGYYHNQEIDETDGDNVNKKEELDALCDIQYVLSGAVLALGHHNHFDTAFADVQESNMSKMCHNEKEVEDTLNFYKNKNVKTYSTKKGDAWIISRTSDNKILKNVYYKEVDLEKYIKMI